MPNTPRSLGDQHNDGKVALSLCPAEIREWIASVLQDACEGRAEYERNNWRKGLSWVDNLDSVLRHITAFEKGQDVNPDTGIHHLKHALTRLMFSVYYVEHALGVDDRYSAPRRLLSSCLPATCPSSRR